MLKIAKRFRSTKTVTKFERDQILQRYLNFHYDFPIALTEKLIRQKKIFIERDSTRQRVVSSKELLQENDIVTVNHTINNQARRKTLDEVLQQPLPALDADTSLFQEQIKSSVLYQDDDVLILNKPANLAIHSGTKNKKIHMQRFFQLLRGSYEQDPKIVHRLDKKVSGALALGRNLYSTRKLAQAFAHWSSPDQYQNTQTPSVDAFGKVVNDANVDKKLEDCPLEVEKTYWAVLSDLPPKSTGIIDRHLYIPPESGVDLDSSDQEIPSQYQVTVQHPDRINKDHRSHVKRAVTKYQVLEEIGRKGCFIQLQPQTGRKHQLRVHCASVLSSPILGDFKYGIRSFKKLHEIGWAQNLDLTKYTGMKQIDGGMPMFLHLRQVRIKNYFKQLGSGSDNKNCREGDDLVVTAGLPPMFKELLKSVGVHYQQKI